MADSSLFPAQIRPFEWTELEDRALPHNAASSPVPELPAAPDPAALLEEARQQAEALLAAARTDADALREEARRKGHEAGREEGRRSAEETASRWQDLAAELADCKERLYEEARGQVVELVLALTGKILGPLAEGDREAVVRVTGRALQALSDREVLTIRVNPEDLQGLMDAKPRLLQAFDGIKKLTVLEDPSVDRGGCLVETATAEIDARLDSQLREIARALRKP
jgi:flagellar assembly protein FliH